MMYRSNEEQGGDETMLKERCATAWNQLSIDQQIKYGCILNFVQEFCINDNLSDEELDKITDFVDKNDTKTYERWYEEQVRLGNRKKLR